MRGKCSDYVAMVLVHTDFNSHDQIVHSPLWFLYVSLKISYENLVLNQNNNFYLISLSILITCFLDNVWIL